jgi:long-chain acyl-CoA synthetase
VTTTRQLEHFDNLVALFLTRAEEKGDAPFLWAKRDGEWRSTSWPRRRGRSRRSRRALKRIGLQPGDRVAAGQREPARMADRRPRDHGRRLRDRADLHHQHRRAITRTSSANSGARAVIVSNQKLATEPRAGGAHLVRMPPCHRHRDDPRGRCPGHPRPRWPELIAGETPTSSAARDRSGVGRGDLACIIYTSGTGGAPRGVQQHHGAILHNVEGCTDIISTDFGWDDEVFLSFLPASHAYEHTGGQHFPIALGAQIYYAESLEKLAANIEEVQPTIMVVVPRLFEMLRRGS